MKNLFSRRLLCLISVLALTGLAIPCTAFAEEKAAEHKYELIRSFLQLDYALGYPAGVRTCFSSG